MFRQLLVVLLAFSASHLLANNEYAGKFMVPEKTNINQNKKYSVAREKMAGYLDAFAQDGKVTAYLGFGKDVYYAGRAKEMANAIDYALKAEKLKISKFNFDDKKQMLSFHDDENDLDYSVQFGNERNEYRDAYQKYEIVAYMGHSRYGRGPAFETYQNYFRLGNIFDTIEIETENKYFQAEPIQLTETYPLKDIEIGGKNYKYQYKGQKTESSYLPETSYTKNIPGGPADFNKVPTLDGKQIFFIHSCENIHYFKEPIRKRFPKTTQKLVFGTIHPSYGNNGVFAAMLAQFVAGAETSDEVVAAMNKIQDCGDDCFVAY